MAGDDDPEAAFLAANAAPAQAFARLLARHIRGDLDAYPPWFWK